MTTAGSLGGSSSPSSSGASGGATLPPPDDYARALRRERLDASILRSLGERRALRVLRDPRPSAWDPLEKLVMRASTVIWEMPDATSSLHDDLLGFCAFLARELEVTEGLDLPYEDEWKRLQAIAPRAIAVLDEIGADVAFPHRESNPIRRALAGAFSKIRLALLQPTQVASAEAA